MIEQSYLIKCSGPNRTDQRVMAMKGNYTFSKALGLESHNQIKFGPSLAVVGSYPSAEEQSIYSTASTDRADKDYDKICLYTSFG